MKKQGQVLARIERAEAELAALARKDGAAVVAQELRALGFGAFPWATNDGQPAVSVDADADAPLERREQLTAKLDDLDRRGFGGVLVVVLETYAERNRTGLYYCAEPLREFRHSGPHGLPLSPALLPQRPSSGRFPLATPSNERNSP
ncbi:MAG: hypothetical protein ACYC8T_20855 [Myxococcaceae bacterium]